MSNTLRPPRSSISIGAVEIRLDARLNASHSSSFNAPLTTVSNGSRASVASIRSVSSSRLISMLKIATGTCRSAAAWTAIPVARALFPMLGRPAAITRFPRLSPPASAVSSEPMPVGNPRLTARPSLAASTRDTASPTNSRIEITPCSPFAPSAISSASRCADTTRSAVNMSSLNASTRSRSPSANTRRRIATSATMRA